MPLAARPCLLNHTIFFLLFQAFQSDNHFKCLIRYRFILACQQSGTFLLIPTALAYLPFEYETTNKITALATITYFSSALRVFLCICNIAKELKKFIVQCKGIRCRNKSATCQNKFMSRSSFI